MTKKRRPTSGRITDKEVKKLKTCAGCGLPFAHGDGCPVYAAKVLLRCNPEKIQEIIRAAQAD